jgi:hypothetical protein
MKATYRALIAGWQLIRTVTGAAAWDARQRRKDDEVIRRALLATGRRTGR